MSERRPIPFRGGGFAPVDVVPVLAPAGGAGAAPGAGEMLDGDGT